LVAVYKLGKYSEEGRKEEKKRKVGIKIGKKGMQNGKEQINNGMIDWIHVGVNIHSNKYCIVPNTLKSDELFEIRSKITSYILGNYYSSAFQSKIMPHYVLFYGRIWLNYY
jgi:hypothetical protein